MLLVGTFPPIFVIFEEETSVEEEENVGGGKTGFGMVEEIPELRGLEGW